MKQDLYTIQEVSAILGVSAKTLRRWEETGIIKPIRTVGNQRRYRLEDVKKLERRRRLRDIKKEVKEEIASTLPIAPRPVFIQTESEPQPEFIAAVEAAPMEAPIHREDIHDYGKRFFKPVVGGLFALLFLFGGAVLLQQLGYLGLHQEIKPSEKISEKAVLGTNNAEVAFQLNVNVPGVFGKQVTFLDKATIQKGLTVKGLSQLNGGIITHNANANLGTGRLTASNVVYSLVAGTNITISGNKQNPTISAGITGGVTSLEGASGAVSLSNGSGISLNGLTINNTGVLSVQGQSGDVTFTGGGGIGISGTTISNTDGGSAQNIFKTFTISGTDITATSNNDTINFAAGSGISLVGDAGSKTITITGSGGGLSGLTQNGVLYATSTTTAGTVVGTNGTVLHGVTGGAPVFSSVDLTADVANILPLANGGTGIGTINPGNGQILIGNGSGYSLATISQGAGLGVTNGAGSITLSNTGVTSAVAGSGIGVSGATGAVTITNNGVLSLTGTANEVNVSGSTGAVVLSLPQNIATTSTPTFASLTLGASSNQLTLGTGNTATITTATLTSGHTYTLPDGSGTFCLVELNNCTGGGGGGIGGSGSQFYIPIFTGSTSVGDSNIYDNGKVGIGTTSPEGLFSVSGTSPGFALTELNQTGTGDILTGSASGVTRFVFDANGNLNIIGGAYQISGANVLTSNALGTGILSSSLTSVGNLSSGSLTTGFGSILTTNTIQGSDITSTGTTGLTASGNGAGLTFSGSGNHIISASTGILELGAATLTGAITGNGQNVTGLGTINGLAITANTGTITSGTWNATAIGALYGGTGINTSGSTGVPYISGGIWSVDANALAATHGGTGQTGYAVGDLLYADTTTSLAKRTIGLNGEVLTVSGGVPVWTNVAGAINFWQENQGTIEPFDITDDLLLGGTSSASAKFAFINNATGTPIASISANTANNATYLTGDGTLATTNRQSLTLGSASTGNIDLFGFGAGVVHTNASGVLSEGLVQNTELQNNSISLSYGTGLSGSASVALGGTLTLNNIGVTSAVAGTGISLSGGTGAVTITNAGVTSVAGTANQVLVNSGTSAQTGAITLTLPQSIDSGASPTFTSLTLSSFTSPGGPLYTNGLGALAQVTAGTSHQLLHGGATPSFGAVDLTADVTGILPVANGGTNANSVGANGALAYSTGSAYAFTTVGGLGQVLESNGVGAPSWVTSSSVGTNYWQLVSGALSPLTGTNDLLLGSTATSSAKFAFENVGSGTPTASISANTANNSTYITGDGTLGTTDKQTLTLGSASTGNIDLFGFGTGVVQSTSGVLSTGAVTNSELQNNSISLSYGTGLSGSASVALGGTLTLNNIGVTSAVAGTGISLSGGTGAVTITNSGVTSLVGGSGGSSTLTGALTITNSVSSGSTVTLDKATTTTLGIASFNSSNFSVSSGAVTIATGGVGPTELASTAVTANTYGGAGNGVGEFTVDSDGRLTFATNRAIGLSTADVTGTLGVGNGGTGTATTFTQGSLVFAGASGIYSQDNSNLFYTATSGLLGIGTNAPVSRLDVVGAIAGKALSILNYTGTDQNILVASTSGTEEFAINNNGSLQFNGNAGFLNTLNTTGSFSSGQTYSFPNSGGTICILQAGNCAGSGSGVTHTGGGVNQLTYFDASNDITSSSNLVFTNDLEVTGANGSKAAEILNQLNSGNIFTASASGTTEFNINSNGNLQFAGGSSFLNTITTAPATAARTYTFPDVTGTVCLVEAGNCAGSGSGVTHTGGGVNQLTYFDGSNDISSSSNLVWNNDLEVTGANGGKAALILNQLNSGNIFTASASGTTEFTIGHDGTITSGKYTTNNGLLYTNGSGVITQAAAGTDGQVLLSNSGTPTFATISGDATISDTGALTLKNVGTSATYGSASQVPVFTTDAQGRVTGVTNTSIAIAGSQITSGLVSTTNGGTGANLSGASQYSIPYFSAAGVLGGALPPGTAGYVLTTNNSGSAPGWTNAASLGTNYWQSISGVLSPLTTNNVLSATSSATTVATFTTNNPTGTLANNTLIQNTGAGIVTNLLNLTQGAGTVTNAIAINGTVGSALSVGGTPIINGSGVLLSAGLSGTYSQALTLSNATNSITAGTLTATGGTINGISIGATTPSTGAFTTLSANNTVTFSGLGTGLIKSTSGTLSIATAGTDYQVPLTFNNGLTNTANTVQLGGPLTQATSISFGNNNLILGDNTGKGNLTVSPNAGGQAALIVNKQGGNDIFTASASGATKFVISNNGSLALAGGQTSDIDTLSAASLTIGGSIQNGLTLGRAGAATTINGSSLIIGPTTITATPTISGLITANGGLQIASGKNLSFAGAGFITNDNSVLYTDGSGDVNAVTTATGGQCLLSQTGPSGPVWGACPGGGTTNYWQTVAGALSPLSETQDLLLGSTATTSAEFAFTGVDTNTPVASIAATPSSGTSNGLSLNGVTNTIQSLNDKTLTIGGNTTGNIALADNQIQLTGSTPIITSANGLQINTGANTLTLNQGGAGSIQFFSSSNTLTSGGNLTIAGTLNGDTITTGTGTLTLGSNTVTASSNTTLAGNSHTLTLNANATLNQDLQTTSTVTFANLTDSGLGINAAVYTNGSSQLTTTAPTSGVIGYFQRNLGALSPANITDDLLLGGTATTSAKFAFTGADGTTPVASISAQNGTGSNGLALGTGTIQSLNNNTLTIGGNTTGNILIDSQSLLNLNTTNNKGITTGNGLTTLGGNLTINGTTGISLAGTNAGISFTSGTNIISSTGTLQINAFQLGGTENANSNSITGINTASFGSTNLSISGTTIQTISGTNNITITPNSTGNIVLTSTYQSGVLIGSGSNTPAPLSISGGIGNNGALIVNQTNSGDIFDASASGTLKFQVTNGGSLNLAGGQTIDTITAGSLGIGTTTQNGLTLGRAGAATTINGSSLIIGPTTITATPTISGLITANGGLQIASGKNLSFAGAGFITNDNSVLYTDGSGDVNAVTTSTSGLCLVSQANTPTWGSCATGTTNYWQTNSGTLEPINTGNDLLLGGTATTSAKFAFINNATGTPTASISANTGNNATYLTGAGVLGTTNAQTLALGSASTGNILIDSPTALSLNTVNNKAITTGNGLTTLGGNLSINGTTGISLAGTNAGISFTSGTNIISSTGTLQINAFQLGGTENANSNSITGINTASFGSTNLSISGTTIQTISGTNNITITPNSTGNIVLTSTYQSGVLIGSGSNTPAPLSISGGIGNNGALIVNNNNSGDLIDASASGITKFQVSNAGNVTAGTYNGNTITSGTGTLTLSSNTLSVTGNASLNQSLLTTSAPQFANIKDTGLAANAAVYTDGSSNLTTTAPTSGVIGYFQRNLGALSPANITDDLLLGGTATTSAKFAFTGADGTTPVASISAQNGTGSNGLALGTGTIQSLNNNTLTIGGNTTGNILIDSQSLLNLNTTNNKGITTGTGLTTLGGSLQVNGNIIQDSGALTRITLGATTTLTNTTTTLSGTTTLTASSLATLTSAGTLGISANTLNLGNGSSGVVLGTTLNQNLSIAPNGTGQLLLSSTYQSGVEIGSSLGSPKAPLFINGGIGNNGALIVNQTNSGDIFDASASGATKFSVNNNGDILLSGTTRLTNAGVGTFATGTVVGTDTFAANAINDSGALAINSNLASTLTLQSTGTGNIQFFNSNNTITSAGALTLASNLTVNGNTINLGNAGSSTIQTTGANTGLTLISNGTGNITLGQNSGNGTVVIQPNAGGQAALIVNKQGGNDIFTASSSGASKFTIQNDGTIVSAKYTSNNGLLYTNGSGVFQQLAIGGTGTCLMGGGSLTWSSCAAGTNLLQENLGALAPANITDDLLLGGTATSSAKFAFENMSGGTPTASISGNLSLAVPTGANPQATFNVLNGGSLNFQSSVGGDAGLTSRLYIANNGNVGIDNNNPSYNLDVTGTGHFSGNVNPLLTIQRIAASNAAIQYENTGGSWYTGINGGNNFGFRYNNADVGTNPMVVITTGGAVGIDTLNNNPLAQLDVRTQTATSPIATFSGATNFAGLVVDNSGSGDIFTASAAGATRLTLTNGGSLKLVGGQTSDIDTLTGTTLTIGGSAQTGLTLGRSGAGTTINGSSLTLGGFITAGGLLFTNNTGVVSQTGAGTSGQCLLGGATPTWGSCSLGTNYWQLNGTVISQANTTEDLTLGGTSTASAKFAFIGNAGSATPIASISAQTGNGTTGLVLSGSGAIQSLNKNTLTIGGSTTGDIAFQPGGQAVGNSLYLSSNGNVGVGTSAPGYALDIQGNGSAITDSGFRQYNTAAVSTSNSVTYDQQVNSSTGQRTAFEIQSSLNATTDSSRNSLVLFNTANAGTFGTAMAINGGNVGVGTTTPSALLDIAGTASVSGQLTLYGTPQIQSSAMQALTLGGATTGNIVLQPGSSTGSVFIPYSGSGSANAFSVNVSGATGFNVSNSGGAVNVQIGSSTCQNPAGYGAGKLCVNQSFSGSNGSDLLTQNMTSKLTGTTNSDSVYNEYSSLVDTTSSTGNNLYGFVSDGINTTNASSTINSYLAKVNSSQPGNFLQFLNGATTAMQVTNAGSLSLGTTSPLATLDVRGNIATNPTASFSGATTNAGVIVDQSGSGDLFTASKSGATKFTITNAGNIIAPNYNGNNAVLYGASGTGAITAVATTSTGGQCLLSGASSAAPTWGSCALPTNYWQLTGTVISQANTTEDLTLGGTSTASAKFAFIGNAGTATPVASIAATPSSGGTNGLSLNGNGTIQSLNRNTLTLGGNTTGDIAFQPGGQAAGNSLYLASNGNVGVGTTTPTATLDIAGNASTSGNLTFRGGGAQKINLLNNSSLGFYNSVGGDVGLGANPALFIGNNGLVGLGTTSPVRTLDVVGSSGTGIDARDTGGNTQLALIGVGGINYIESGQNSFGTGNAPLYITGANSGLGSNLFINYNNVGIGTNATGNDELVVNQANSAGDIFSASQSGSTKFVISNNGNVGIGTTAPSQVLTVAGSANYGVEQIVGNGTNVESSLGFRSSNIANGSIGTWVIGTNLSGTTVNNFGIYAGGNGFNIPVMMFNTNGNVGIGTTSAIATFDVRSNQNTTPVASFSGATLGANTVIDQSGTGDIFTASKSGATKFVINNAGNVGIGTTTPQQALDVVGSIRNLATTSASLTLLSSTGLSNPESFAVAGRYLYIGNVGNGKLLVYDISNPASPAQIGNVSGTFGPGSFVASGKYVYSATSGGFEIFDVSNPAAPVQVSNTSGISQPSGLAVQGKYVYLTDLTGNNLIIFDVSNPANPIKVGSTTSGLSNPNGIAIQGRYAYVVTGGGALVIFDISNPAAPVEVTSAAVFSNAKAVSVSGRYAYVVDSSTNSLVALDISNPSSISQLGSISTGLKSPDSIAVAGRYAYVASNGNNSLVAFDISNPSSLSQAGSTIASLNGVGQVAVSGRYVITVAGGGGNNDLNVYDSGGIETTAILAHSAEAGILTVDSNAVIGNQLNVGGGLNVGEGGLYTAGSIAGGDLNILSASAISPVASISGATSFAGVVVDNTGVGDIFTASKSGSTKFVINNNGNIQFSGTSNFLTTFTSAETAAARTLIFPNTPANDTVCLLTLGNCSGGATQNFWQMPNPGAIAPFSTTADLLIGGTATISAKFAFTGVDTTSPVASIAANPASGTSTGLALSGSGAIQSLNNNTLTLGGNTTGDIAFQPGGQSLGTSLYLASNGTVGIGTAAPGATFDIESNSLSATNAFNLSASGLTTGYAEVLNANGVAVLTSGGALSVIGPTGAAAITANSGLVKISATGAITTQTGAGSGGLLDVQDNAIISGTLASISDTATMTGNGQLLNVTGSGATTTTTGLLSVSGVALTTGYAEVLNANGVAVLTSGGALSVIGPTGAAAITANSGLVKISATGAITTQTGAGSGGLLDVQDNAIISGTLASISDTATMTGNGQLLNVTGSGATTTTTGLLSVSGVALTTGYAEVLNANGVAVLTSGGALSVIGPTGAAAITANSGLVKISATGAITTQTGAGSGGLLDVQDNAIISGTLASISDTATMTGNGQLLNVTGSGATTTTTGLLSVSGVALTTGYAEVLNANGVAVLTSGGALSVIGPTGAAAITANSGLVKISATGAITTQTGAGSGGLLDVQDNAIISGTLASISDTANMTTTGNLLTLAATSATTATGIETINAPGLTTGWGLNVIGANAIQANGNLGVGSNFSTVAPMASLDVRGLSGTTPAASVSAASSFASLIVNNSGTGDIFTASKSGATKFTIQNSGVVVIGNNTNGIIFDPTELSNPSGQIYFGTARPTRQIVLSPEYDGVVLSASGSANANGFMTSDASPSAQDNQSFRTYYQWTSTQTSTNNYNVVVRVTLPKDFSAWPTTNAMTVDMNTQLTTSADNALSVYIYNHNFSDSTPVLYDQNETSGSQKTWKTITYTGAQLSNWSAGGQTATIFLNMQAKNSNYVQVGDIVLNYQSAY